MLSNYPDGLSDFTPGTPWNEPDVPEKEFDVTCTQTLSRTVSVLTSNYVPGASGVDYEPDDEGGYYASGWHDPDDTSDTNWADEYHDNDYLTPLQLIEIFKQYLENDLNRMGEVKNERWIKHLIEECSNWTEDETEYVED
jgi:hypothetical protein